MKLALTEPPPQAENSVTDMTESLLDALRALEGKISKSKSLAKDAVTFCAELIKSLEDLKDKFDPRDGEWLSSGEVTAYEATKQRIIECEVIAENANDARNTVATMIRWICDGNADATLRNAIERFAESLGPAWEKRPLPRDPLDLLTLFRAS